MLKMIKKKMSYDAKMCFEIYCSIVKVITKMGYIDVTF